MPDDVKEMLGIPIQSKSRSRSEPRTPRKTPSKVILVRHNWHWTVMVHTFNIHRWIQRSQGHHPKHPKRPNRNKIFITLPQWRRSLHSKRRGIKSMHFWRSLHQAQVEVARGSSLWPLQRWLTTSHLPALLLTLLRVAVFRTRSTWRMSSSLQPRQRQSSSKLQVILVLFFDWKASKSYSISSATEDVPPPTNDDVAERLVKRLLILCQRGEWDIAGENLKVVGDSQNIVC